jgi:hypothetical protein
MDQRDATRFAIAQTRHNLSLIAEEIAHRTNVEQAKLDAKRFAKKKTLHWLSRAATTPVAIVVIGVTVGIAGYAAYRRFVS